MPEEGLEQRRSARLDQEPVAEDQALVVQIAEARASAIPPTSVRGFMEEIRELREVLGKVEEALEPIYAQR
jgi:hypothetical protein